MNWTAVYIVDIIFCIVPILCIITVHKNLNFCTSL